jgi:UDP-2,3-diacylglucosamine pyrophosphatase LpxH
MVAKGDTYLTGFLVPLEDESVFDKEIRGYLTLLDSQLSGRQAAQSVGYYPTSTTAYESLLYVYGVDRDQRNLPDSDMQSVGSVHVPKVSKSKRRHVSVETAVVFGDNHGLETDPAAFGVMLAVIADLKPERGFINGDFVNFDSISRFSKAPEQELMLQAEVEQANELLDKLQAASPDTVWVYIEGNHEVRLREYVRRNAKGLAGLKTRRGEETVLGVSNLFSLKERGIEYVKQVGKSGYVQYGAITIGHFDKYSQIPGAVAKWFLEHRNETVIQGHTHKRCQLDRRFPDGREITAVEHGCLCQLTPEYVTDPDWAQGFVIITKRVDTDRFHINAVRIVDGEALVGDVLYGIGGENG